MIDSVLDSFAAYQQYHTDIEEVKTLAFDLFQNCHDVVDLDMWFFELGRHFDDALGTTEGIYVLETLLVTVVAIEEEMSFVDDTFPAGMNYVGDISVEMGSFEMSLYVMETNSLLDEEENEKYSVGDNEKSFDVSERYFDDEERCCNGNEKYSDASERYCGENGYSDGSEKCFDEMESDYDGVGYFDETHFDA